MENESIENNTDNIFTIYVNNATGIIIENSEKRHHSIFSNVYDSFFQAISDFLSTKESESNESSNNIFAFIGDRGSGKTSCMNSVAKMLECYKGNEKNPIFEDSQSHVFLRNKSFEVLKSTDPSFFDGTKNILDIVLGRLFSRFEEEVKKRNLNKTNEKNEVLQNFENVKHSLACMDKKNICEDSSVDQLIDLSASVDLKKYIGSLIESYLKYIEKDYLVIPVDDIDLHTIYAFDMAEQIRKYLIQPKTIILMALKIPQLEYAIERHYLNHYKDMLEKNFLDKSSITDMAIKYLIKFIPQSHRFPLKTIEELLSTPVEIKNGDNTIKKGSILKDCVTEEIFDKTRFLPYKHTEEASLIIPRNLRECCYLLEFLIRMRPYSEGSIGNYNHEKFVNYFLNTWSGILKNEDFATLNKIYYSPSFEQLNQSIIIYLNDKLTNNIARSGAYPISDIQRRRAISTFDSASPINKIISKTNSPRNVSIGDLIFFLEYYESKISQDNDKAFIFAIKTLYSDRLNHLFIEKDKSFANSISKQQPLEKKSDFNTLVGGAFISESDTRIDEHFTKRNTKKCEQEIRRVISIQDIRKKLEEALDPSRTMIVDMQTFKTVEFFALTLSRPYDFNSDEDFRTKSSHIYTEEISQNNPYVWFDIFSLFYNITQLELCYNRISKDFYNISANNSSTILSQFLRDVNNRIVIEGAPFVACCSFRNLDILEQIRKQFISGASSQNTYIDTFKSILESCKEFNSPIYDKSNYDINFDFVDTIIQFLSDANSNKAFNSIYLNATDSTLDFIDDIETKIESLIKKYNQAEETSSIDMRKIAINTINQINSLSQRLKFSRSIILEQIDEHGLDRIYPSSSINAFRNFLDWLKTLPVIA
jgi:hypothetical protein